MVSQVEGPFFCVKFSKPESEFPRLPLFSALFCFKLNKEIDGFISRVPLRSFCGKPSLIVKYGVCERGFLPKDGSFGRLFLGLFFQPVAHSVRFPKQSRTQVFKYYFDFKHRFMLHILL